MVAARNVATGRHSLGRELARVIEALFHDDVDIRPPRVIVGQDVDLSGSEQGSQVPACISIRREEVGEVAATFIFPL
jgi:hypothetical protein